MRRGPLAESYPGAVALVVWLFAMIELMRGVTGFLVAPILAFFAATAGRR
jgi:hypothetical protein